MIPKKAFAPLGFSLAAFLVLGVALAGPSSHVLAEDTPTNYTKTITITPSMIPYTNTHTAGSITQGGLLIKIGGNVFASGGWIVFNNSADGIQFPRFSTTPSGPHGTGYQSVTFGKAPSSGYSYDMGVKSYTTSGTVKTSEKIALSKTTFTTFTLTEGYPDYPFVYSFYTGNISTRIAYLSVSYGCVSA